MLYEEAGENRLASEMTALRGLREGHPELGAEELQHLNNQVLLMIAEYHLTSASQGTHHILPVLPEGATRLMPPLEDYLPGSFDGCRDIRVTDRAQILRVAIWLHRLDLRATYGAEIAASPRVEDYDIGPLLEYFLMPKLSDITLGEVASRVAQENRQDMEISLRDLHEETCSRMRSSCWPVLGITSNGERLRKLSRSSWTPAGGTSIPTGSVSPGWRSSLAWSNLGSLPRVKVASMLSLKRPPRQP